MTVTAPVGTPGRDLLRYVGLAATTAIAIGAYGSGALPSGDPAPGLRQFGLAATAPTFRAGFVLVVAGTAGLLVVWWRLAADARAGTGPPPWWVVGTGVLWALPLLFAPPLASRDVYSYACQGWLYNTGHDPYTVTPVDGGCPWLGAVAHPWLDDTAPYGPVGIAVAAAAAWPAGSVTLPVAAQLAAFLATLRLLILAALAFAAIAGARLARACGVDRSQAALLGLFTPLVGLHAVAGSHLDAVVVAAVVGALWLAVDRPAVAGAVLAGALVGAAAAVKVTAVVAVPFVVILALGAAGSVRRVAGAVVAGVVGAAAAFAAVSVVTGLDHGWVAALSGTTDLVQWTSPPTAIGMCAGYVLRLLGFPEHAATAVALARAAGMAVLGVTVLALVARAWRRRADRRTVIACCGWAFVACVALAPVFYPWYALVPHAVLAVAGPGARTARGLAVVTVVLSLLVTPHGLGVATLTKAPGAVAVTVVVLVVCAVLATRLLTVTSLGWRRHGAGGSASTRSAGPVPAAGSSPTRPGAAGTRW